MEPTRGILTRLHVYVFAVEPEIKTTNPVVHTRPGLQAKIECLVLSNPPAQVHWFFNGQPIRRNNLINLQEIDLVSTGNRENNFFFKTNMNVFCAYLDGI